MNPFYPIVAERAQYRCEYCHAPEIVFNFPLEVEHIIPKSKSGSDEPSNLALACRSCNLRKGNRTTGKLNGGKDFPLFHPREDIWSEHFQVSVDSGEILGLTTIGQVTIASLQMNTLSQLKARQIWLRLGLFP